MGTGTTNHTDTHSGVDIPVTPECVYASQMFVCIQESESSTMAFCKVFKNYVAMEAVTDDCHVLHHFRHNQRQSMTFR